MVGTSFTTGSRVCIGMKPEHYLNVAVVHTDPETGNQTLVGEIERCRAYNAPKYRTYTLEPNCRMKFWICGDRLSEVVYREQGWFPD